MKGYRVGGSWGVTVVEFDESEKADADGKRPGDRLMGTMQTKEDAELVVRALHHQRKFEDQ